MGSPRAWLGAREATEHAGGGRAADWIGRWSSERCRWRSRCLSPTNSRPMTWVAGPGGPTWLCGSHSSRRRQVEASHDAYSIAGGVALPGIQWSSAGRHFATGACQTTRSPPCHESHGSHKGHKSHKSHKSHKGHKGHKGHRGHRGRAIMPTRAWTRRGRAARGVPSGQSFSARSAATAGLAQI